MLLSLEIKVGKLRYGTESKQLRQPVGGPGRSTEWQPNTDPGKHGTLLRAARARRSEKKGEKGRDNLHFYSKPEDFFAFFAPFSRGLCAKNHAGKYGLKGLFLILSPPLPHSTKLTDSAHVRGVARRSKSINSNMTSSGIIICIVDNKWDGAKTIWLYSGSGLILLEGAKVRRIRGIG